VHDINAIIADPAGFDAALARRGIEPQAERLIRLDTDRREAITTENAAKSRTNEISRQIPVLIREGRRREADELKAEARATRNVMPELRDRAEATTRILHEQLALLPNLPAADVPDGADETGNVLLRESTDGPIEEFGEQQHFEIGEALGLMDFERATKMSGSRFVVLRGALAQMSRALGQFMIDLHVREHGYTEVEVPLIVNPATLFGTGQLPKFYGDLYAMREQDTGNGYEQFLIPTAEVPLTNLVADTILKAEEFPLRFTALTPCFRSEAGSAGRDTRGMLRQHQFNKVELVSITEPDQSADEHERMLANAEAVLKALELPYRIMTLCAGDMGFSAQKTYDIEVWLPGQKAYREISSISNCGAFQARRMKARIKGPDGKTIPVHTLNGSGVAVGRALIAVMENYQSLEGGITVPEVLRPYMGGMAEIRPPE
jgi:seryl-tRNA synthetase